MKNKAKGALSTYVAPVMRPQPLVQVTPELFWWSLHMSPATCEPQGTGFLVVSSVCTPIPFGILALTAEPVPLAWSSRSTLFTSVALSTCESCHHVHTQPGTHLPELGVSQYLAE